MTAHKAYSALRSAALGAAVALVLAACSATAAGRSPGRRLILFLDQSASIDRDQRRQWRDDAGGLVREIRDGWSVSVYGVHDHTLEAAALFEVDIPVFAPDGTSKTAAARNAAIQRARQEALASVDKALDTGGAARTDVFGALDRVHPDPRGRPTTIVFFSDMLNSTPELNMERAGSVTLQNIASLIPSLARSHMWRKDLLSEAEVYCVLNSIEIGHNGPAVDRRVQQVFYESLFGALGAKLARYETSLGGVYAARIEPNRLPGPATPAADAREMEQLMAVVAGWGLEAGFLGIDGHLEPRMQALLGEAVRRHFGDFEAERDRLMAGLDSAEAAWDQAQEIVAKYRSRYGSGGNGQNGGWLRRFREWLWQSRDYRSAMAISRREAPILRDLRLSLAGVECTRRAAEGWRETAARGLRANFEFQQARAGVARIRKEEHDNDDRNTKHFSTLRAS